jgi:hypothetical protein
MNAVTKRDVRIGLAADIEAVRFAELFGVAIG